MGDDKELNEKSPSPYDMEDGSGLELSLGLSCGGSITKTKSKDGIKEPNPDWGGNDKMKNGKTGVADASLKHFLQGSTGEKEDTDKQQDDSMHQVQENFWTNLEMNPSKEPEKSVGMCMEQVQFPGFGEPWCAAEESPKASVQQTSSDFTEKTGLTENPSTPESKGNSGNVTKDIQLASHTAAGAAASWGHFAQQNLPVHLINAFRNGTVMSVHASLPSHAKSNSAMQQSVEAQLSSVGSKSSVYLDATQEKRSVDMENANTDQQHKQLTGQQHQHDDVLDQQKKREMSAQKWQEARKKRKLLIEEHKQQKKARKEDERIGPHGFRRPGSNSWVRGWEGPTPTVADRERATSMLELGSDDSQVLEINHPLHRERDGNMKESEPETEKEESSESQREGSNASDHAFLHRMKAQEMSKCSSNAGEGGCCPNENGKDLTKSQSEAYWQKTIEMQLSQLGVQPLTKDGVDCSQDNHLSMSSDSACKQLTEVESAEGLSSRKICRLKESIKQCMSSGTDILEKAEETGEQDIAKSSSRGSETPIARCAAVGNKSNTGLNSVPCVIPGSMTSTSLPYPLPSYSVVTSPYSLPVPVPNNPSIPFPVGFSFPYVMQFVPTTVDGADHSAVRPPLYPSGFQLPLGYAPFQLPTLETGSSWVPVLRPQQSSVVCPPSFGGTRTSLEPGDDETQVSEGEKCYDQHKRPTASSIDDVSNHTIHSLCRADSLGHNQDHGAGLMHLQPMADTRVFSPLSVPPGPPHGLSRTRSGLAEMQLLMDHGGVAAFPGFAAVVQAPQEPPGYVRPTSTGSASKESKKQDSTKALVKDETQLRRASDLYSPDASGTALTFQTVDHDAEGHGVALPNMANGFCQEVSNLRPGIAAGLKFGGTGTTPDLPWVSTTGPGPNGKTISGVLYRYSRSQIRIVCACHGRHMSPSEFVQHAGIVEVSNPEKNVVVNPSAFGSQAASAQV